MKQNEQTERFVDMVSEHQGILHKICHIYCNNSEEKQDMMQEITLQLWSSFPNFQDRSKISTWIYRIALNTAISNIRRSKKHPLVEALFDTDLEIPSRETDPALDEDINTLYQAIARLNDIEKAVIMLYLEEKSYQEIGEITGISEKNVSVKLVRIKKKLKEIIEEIEG